jgi:hypothetical protein
MHRTIQQTVCKHRSQPWRKARMNLRDNASSWVWARVSSQSAGTASHMQSDAWLRRPPHKTKTKCSEQRSLSCNQDVCALAPACSREPHTQPSRTSTVPAHCTTMSLALLPRSHTSLPYSPDGCACSSRPRHACHAEAQPAHGEHPFCTRFPATA